MKLIQKLPSETSIKINYTKSSPECCTFNEVQIKTRLLILWSEQSLESGKTRDGHCSGWKSIPFLKNFETPAYPYPKGMGRVWAN
jgi:hypothetical protein